MLISTDIDCLLKIDEEPGQNLSAAMRMVESVFMDVAFIVACFGALALTSVPRRD